MHVAFPGRRIYIKSIKMHSGGKKGKKKTAEVYTVFKNIQDLERKIFFLRGFLGILREGVASNPVIHTLVVIVL